MTDPKVLLVDDEEEFLTPLTERLRNRGVNVKGVTSGQAALETLERDPIDVVVLDVRMPGMSGLETLVAIKRKYPVTEVLMLTGHADMDTACQGMGCGAFDYLMKPVNIDELIYRIQDAFKAKSLREQEQG